MSNEIKDHESSDGRTHRARVYELGSEAGRAQSATDGLRAVQNRMGSVKDTIRRTNAAGRDSIPSADTSR
jgi:hypothetical protein